MTKEEIWHGEIGDCCCDIMYSSRKMVDPDCIKCNSEDAALKAMDEYAKQQAIEFHEWMIEKQFKRTVGGVYRIQGLTQTHSGDELYQLFLNNKTIGK